VKLIGIPRGLLKALKRMYDANEAFFECGGDLKWLFCILRLIGIPRGLLKALERMYDANEAFFECGGDLKWVFCVISGVLQGCPLSGSLFVICMDPLLYLFKTKIEDQGLGMVRACADDVGATLGALLLLPIFHDGFSRFKRISGLTLKPKKCVLILTTCIASPGNVEVIRKWLRAHCPEWANFQISNVGKYLGFQMGPKAGELQWKAPLDKFKNRVREIHSESPPLGLVGSRLASKATSVLGYIAQLASIPPLFKSTELWAAHKVLNMPLSLNTEAMYDLKSLGGVKLFRVAHYLRSCMLRAASKTMHGYEEMHLVLCSLAVEGTFLYTRGIPGSEAHDLRPDGWLSNAFCSNLCNASKGLGLGMDEHANAIASCFASVIAGNHGKGRKSHQKVFYDLLQGPTPADWPKTFAHKLEAIPSLSDLVPPLGGWHLDSERHISLCSTCGHLGVRTSMAAIKSWANAWTTTTRMHEAEELQCIFGCDAPDNLDHYLSCDPLWTMVISNSFKREELLSASPLQKLGLTDNSKEWLQMLAIAFSCYHAIKSGHRSEISNNDYAEGRHPYQVHDRLFEYARTFSRDIVIDR